MVRRPLKIVSCHSPLKGIRTHSAYNLFKEERVGVKYAEILSAINEFITKP
jgi:hypothetical protein